MGKLFRGGLWVTFWPAGLIASTRAGNRKRHAEVLDAIRDAGGAPPPRPRGADASWKFAIGIFVAGVGSLALVVVLVALAN
jgi:hypothetical protein